MNRTQLIEKITEQTGVEKKAVANVLAGLGDVVLASVAKGDSVLLPGIAKFTKVKRKARVGRNPATGAAVKIPAKTVAKVTALKLYKETVLGNAPAPKLQKVAPAAAPAKPAARSTSRAAAPKATSTRAAATKAAPKVAATAAKPASRAAAKAPAKPAARATRTAAKPAARSTRAAATKTATKPVAKTAAKAPARAAPPSRQPRPRLAARGHPRRPDTAEVRPTVSMGPAPSGPMFAFSPGFGLDGPSQAQRRCRPPGGRRTCADPATPKPSHTD